MIKTGLLDVARRHPIILDAAMGTRLIARGLALVADDPCLWTLTHPQAVHDVHALDIAAGADALLTNTFGANRVWLARFGRAGDTRALNRRAAAIARDVAGPSRFVLGSIGPTAASAADAYREQAEALAEAGVDALVFETHRIADARTALQSVRPVVPLPLIVSLVVWTDPVPSSVRLLEDLGASAIGGNCQVGMASALSMVDQLRTLTRLPLWVKPSAALPGEPPARPESFAAAVPGLLAAGVRFVGGCCGTTAAHVAALRAACEADRG